MTERASGWYWILINEESGWICAKWNAVGEAWWINGLWMQNMNLQKINERRILRAEN